ncbi:MAG: glycosyltransferase family 61 protein [Janthinobacterium lividum]
MLNAFGLPDDWLSYGAGPIPPCSSWVFMISNAIVLSSSGIVALPTGEVLEDTLDHTWPPLDGYQRGDNGTVLVPGPIPYDPGYFLSLLLGGHDNHFHWLVMSLARAALLTPEDMQGLDGILVPADLSGTQMEALELSGLSRHAPFRFVQRGEALQVRRLLLPWNIATGAGVSPIGAAWLNELVHDDDGDQRVTRRIYLDRRAAPTRRLINEEELVEVLVGQGIQPVRLEDLSLAKQVLLMRQAELIVAPHGAGLANLAFARPGTKVLELMPSAALNWCYRHLAAVCGLRYDCVLGRSQNSSVQAPWIVSPTHVLSALAEIAEVSP